MTELQKAVAALCDHIETKENHPRPSEDATPSHEGCETCALVHRVRQEMAKGFIRFGETHRPLVVVDSANAFRIQRSGHELH